jgi:murein DD-endopeptidase MepM/ murein hydrolase activator NlpD
VSRRRKFLLSILGLFIAGFLVPERRVIPVLGATSSDWNPKTFWFEPWGSSGVHKGMDIFAAQGQPVLASTDLIVLYRGQLAKGGLVVVGLGPKWRLHYFAHLDAIDENTGLFASAGSILGTVGSSGNAAGKQPHLHFSIASLVPLPWRIDSNTQGYKKAFYLDPTSYF